MIISLILNIGTSLTLLLFYLYLMNENNIRWLNLLAISSVYFIGVSYLIEITGYVEWNLLIVFLLIGMRQFYIKREINILWNITVALFTWITFIMLQEIITILLFNLFAYSSWIPVLLSIQQLAPVSTGIVIVLIVLLRKKLMKTGTFLERSSWLYMYFAITLVIAGLMLMIKGSGAQALFASTGFILNISTVYYPLMLACYFLLILIIILDSKIGTIIARGFICFGNVQYLFPEAQVLYHCSDRPCFSGYISGIISDVFFECISVGGRIFIYSQHFTFTAQLKY